MSVGTDRFNELSDSALNGMNISGIVVASVSLFVAVIMFVVIVIQFLRFPKRVWPLCSTGPTQLLYISLAASVPFSIFWIISCTLAASKDDVCKTSMWAIVFFLNLIVGFLTLMLLQCALLLSSRWSKAAHPKFTPLYSAIIVAVSLALSFTGLLRHNYGYRDDLETCWVTTKSTEDSMADARAQFGILCLVIYGPLFLCLLLNVVLFIYVLLRISRVYNNQGGGNLRAAQSVSKALTRRVAFIPLAVGLHTLLVFAGDLPIHFASKTAQWIAYFCNYIGFSSFTIFIAACAMFIDPTFLKICRLNSNSEPAADLEASEDGGMDAVAATSYAGSYAFDCKSQSSGSPYEVATEQTSPVSQDGLISPTSPRLGRGLSLTGAQSPHLSRRSAPPPARVSMHEGTTSLLGTLTIPSLVPGRTDPLPQLPTQPRNMSTSTDDSEIQIVTQSPVIIAGPPIGSIPAYRAAGLTPLQAAMIEEEVCDPRNFIGITPRSA
jgi:hypothetical protein